MQGRAVAQKPNAQFLNQVEVVAPVLVVAAFSVFVLPDAAVLNGRVTIFNAGGKQKMGNAQLHDQRS